MNNTHTSGLIKDHRKAIGAINYRSGVSTPNGNILERSQRSHNNSLEESKISDHQNISHLNQSSLSYKMQNNLSSFAQPKLSESSGNGLQPTQNLGGPSTK